jgi:choline dehydrogenase-like flavoprotein
MTAGLGNQHDLVGRYFMDHPRMLVGRVEFAHEWSRNKLYDIKYNYHNVSVSAHGQSIAAQLALTPAAMEAEQVLNARVCFCSEFPGEGSEGAKALFRCKQALLKKEQPGWSLADDLATMSREPVNTFLYGFTRLFHPRALIRNVGFQLIVEPAPNPDSRVTLSTHRRDALGMPRVEVDWQIATLVRRTADRTIALIARELQATGVARVDTGPSLEEHGWPVTFEKEGTWHHMGTTRMHDDERQGVVDRDCRVHGFGNFYIAGSSVFPTAGANFPTITLTALALRLADHIAAQLKSDSSAPVDETAVAASFIDAATEAIAASVGAGGLPAT